MARPCRTSGWERRGGTAAGGRRGRRGRRSRSVWRGTLQHPRGRLHRMTPTAEHRRRLDLALDEVREPLDRLVAVRQLRRHLGRLQSEVVDDALERGATLAEIARALAISRQAVHRRYGGGDGSTPPASSVAESPEDAWWRRRRELEAMAERYFAAVRASTGPRLAASRPLAPRPITPRPTVPRPGVPSPAAP